MRHEMYSPKTLFPLLPLLLLWLAGCPYVGEEQFRDIKDFDNDKVIAERFGGKDCDDHDPKVGDCDADEDGFRSVEAGGDDCDDLDPNVHPDADERCNEIDDDCDSLIDDADEDLVDAPTWYADVDSDGFGDPDSTMSACVQPANHVGDDQDCDDTRDDIRPGATEFCDALDRNCDGDPILDAVDPVAIYADADGDGYGAGASIGLACTPGAGESVTADDCDDAEALAHPGAAEVWYDGIDSDCAGDSDYDQDGDGHDILGHGGDCDDEDASILPGATEICDGGVDNNCNGVADSNDPTTQASGQWTYYLDADGDAFGDDATATLFCPNTAPNGWILLAGDCDDTLDSVLPGGTETCDNRDNDCDGIVDDGAVEMVEFYVDGDGDGYGGTTTQRACAPGPGLVNVGGDCNDGDPQTYPGAPEICGDLFRQDCTTLALDDCDSDGHSDAASGGDDCDDTRDDVHPGANEVCDGVDNSCNGLVDDDDPAVDLNTLANWYTDADGDGWGGPTLFLPNACAPVPGAATNNLDCDDNDPDTHPEALELCDGKDNDCDPEIDEGPLVAPLEYHYDGDGDGFGNPNLQYAQGCDAPGAEWVLDDSDCHDGFYDVNPLAQEVCDGLDNDCDGLKDDADPSAALSLWYQDDDGDGYGQTGLAVQQCGQPAGYAPLGGDCNDFSATQNPGASEICDGGIDNDCDGLGDDADPDLAAAVTWFADMDNDGFGDASTSLVQCNQPAGWVSNAGDCDDAQASVSPAAIELCDGADNDCDTLVDDDDPGVVGAPFWYADLDGDAWGDDQNWVRACTQPAGRLPQAGDCNDSDDAIHPGSPETCDGIDNDCDLLTDDADPGVIPTTWYADTDTDGAGDPAVSQAQCAFPGAGWTTDASDCDDTNPSVHPLAAELCNLYDDNCDGRVDDDDPTVSGQPTWYADLDRDGWGDDADTLVSCAAPQGYVTAGGDCDDLEPRANPGVTIERCNGFDDNCDTLVDDQDPTALGTTRYWPDTDGDLAGDATDPGVLACSRPQGWADNDRDCNDASAQIGPGATEICNGVDDDCDTLVDAQDPQLADGLEWFADLDGDTFGNPGLSVVSCTAVPGYVPNGSDCDDFEPTAWPGAPEICDGGIDNDCDGLADDADLGVTDRPTWYDDGDNDGYGLDVTGIQQCTQPVGWSSLGGDCDDTNPNRNPGEAEVCDTFDNDCDGQVDDQDGDLTGGTVFYTDADSDGFGDPTLPVSLCAQRAGVAAQGTDCDDTDPELFPGQVLQVAGAGGAWPTIQSAIDAACEDGEVRIVGGVWTEQLDLRGKRLTVGGLDPDAPPRLQAAGPAILAVSGEPAGTAVENLRISGSTAVDGAGAQVGAASRVIFRNVGFDRLTATNSGGAVLVSGGRATFEQCDFTDNTAPSGGAIYATAGTVTVRDSWFSGNSGTLDGAAIYAQDADVVVSDSVIEDQPTGTALVGRSSSGNFASLAGVVFRDTERPVELTDMDVFVDDVDSYGSVGRFYVAGLGASVAFDALDLRIGGVSGSEYALELYGPLLAADLSNLTIYGNNAGGMLAQSTSGLVLDQSSFVGNGTTGLDFSAGSATVSGVLVYGNGSFPELADSGSWALASTVAYSLFTNGAEAGTWGGTNLSGDPLFQTWHTALDPTAWDLHPRAGSPALDAGDPGRTDTDGSRADIGATGGPQGDARWYEDLDGDGLLDGWERAWFGTLTARSGLEDDDSDALDTAAEQAAGTSPLDFDTDGDGTPDGSDGAPLNSGA